MAKVTLNISEEIFIENETEKLIIGYLNAQIDIDIKMYSFNIQIENKESYIQNTQSCKEQIEKFETMVKEKAVSHGWDVFKNISEI